MRIWQGALAAALMVAGQAEAATWVRYTASGSGIETYEEQTLGDPIFYQRARDFIVSFSVDIDPNLDFDNGYFSNGSFFRIFIDSNGFLDVTGSPTTLVADLDLSDTRFREQLDFGATFNGTSPMGGFVTAINPIGASGSFSYLFSSSTLLGAQTRTMEGTINRVTTTFVSGFERVTVLSVPEPATWLMMIVGFGAVGAAMRRRGGPALARAA